MRTRKKIPPSTPRPRGRPLSFDRDTALDRVLPVFWRKGFDGASLDELAAAAQLNRPNLASAFGDKRSLYLASLERFSTMFMQGGMNALQSEGTLRQKLDRFFDYAASLYAAQGLGCFLLTTAPAASRDPEVQQKLADGLEGVRKAFDETLSSATGGKLVLDADIRGVPDALLGVLTSLALHSRAGSDASDLRKMHRTAIGTILKALPAH